MRVLFLDYHVLASQHIQLAVVKIGIPEQFAQTASLIQFHTVEVIAGLAGVGEVPPLVIDQDIEIAFHFGLGTGIHLKSGLPDHATEYVA